MNVEWNLERMMVASVTKGIPLYFVLTFIFLFTFFYLFFWSINSSSMVNEGKGKRVKKKKWETHDLTKYTGRSDAVFEICHVSLLYIPSSIVPILASLSSFFA